MYITAHRVRSRKDEVGINSFFYVHAAEEADRIDWNDNRVVLTVADGLTGQLVAQSYDVPPGGNRVLAYLDVVARDKTHPDAIKEGLRRFKEQLESEPTPLFTNLAGIGIRFGTVMALDARKVAEFDALRTRLMLLMRSERPLTTQQQPIEIIVRTTEQGFSFALTTNSVQRVREAHGSAEFTPETFLVTRDMLLDFNTVHGDLVPHMIASLTSLRLENVIAMGGSRFIDTEGTELRMWPS